MKVIGYGEDALAIWALTQKMPEFLGHLDDDTPTDELVLFFRPSFGRRAASPVPPGGMARSSQFGEFDAIVSTRRAAYLIEAKWSRSSEVRNGAVDLRPEQIRRHRIFRRYLEAWREWMSAGASGDWGAFAVSRDGVLDVEGVRYPIPGGRTQLARSLKQVLHGLEGCGTEIRDIVLYVRLAHGPALVGPLPNRFELVTVECPSGTGFVDLHRIGGPA